MAETQKANVIIPEVFTAYTVVQAIAKSRFFKSGIM